MGKSSWLSDRTITRLLEQYRGYFTLQTPAQPASEQVHIDAMRHALETVFKDDVRKQTSPEISSIAAKYTRLAPHNIKGLGMMFVPEHEAEGEARLAVLCQDVRRCMMSLVSQDETKGQGDPEPQGGGDGEVHEGAEAGSG